MFAYYSEFTRFTIPTRANVMNVNIPIGLKNEMQPNT